MRHLKAHKHPGSGNVKKILYLEEPKKSAISSIFTVINIPNLQSGLKEDIDSGSIWS